MGKAVFHNQKVLSDKYRVITYDMCGSGYSSTFEEPVTIEALSDELHAVLNQLGVEKAIVVGYSAGCSVAQHFVISHPERSLSLLLSGGFPRVKTSLLKLEFQAGLWFTKTAPKQLADIIGTAHAKTKTERAHLVQSMIRSDPMNWHDFYQAALTYSCLNQLSMIDIPFLAMYGQFAHYTRAHASDYQRHLKNANIAIVRHAFHELPTRKSDQLNHMIDTFIQAKVL